MTNSEKFRAAFDEQKRMEQELRFPYEAIILTDFAQIMRDLDRVIELYPCDETRHVAQSLQSFFSSLESLRTETVPRVTEAYAGTLAALNDMIQTPSSGLKEQIIP